MIRIHSKLPPVITEIQRYNFKYFLNQDMDMNIIACRNPHPRPDEFDDFIHIVYKLENKYIEHVYPCTTDAGKYWMKNPMRADGTAVLMAPFQYRSAFTFGLHKGSYKCLVQRKPIKVWRDNDGDLEIEPINEGTAHAIQVHRASSNERSTNVGKWSAGCIVVQTDYADFIKVLEQQERFLGSSVFSVTLLEVTFF